MQMQKPVRMMDIAEKAGVSCTTVSLALKNHPRIGEATKTKILRICKQMGYQPDPAAQALAYKRSQTSSETYLGTLAFLTSESGAELRKRNKASSLWDRQLEQACRNMGYRLDHFVVRSEEKEQRPLSRIMQSRGISGLLIHGYHEEVRQWALDWDRFAVVAQSASLHEHFVHNVLSSSYQDVYDAMMHLKGRGYNRPGYFFTPRTPNAYTAGFSAAMETLNLSARVPKLAAKHTDYLEQKDEFLSWVKKYKPDVIVTSSGAEYIELLEKGGFRVPEDIGYLGLDVLPDTMHLSGLYQSRETTYKVIVDLIHGMLMRNELGIPEQPMCIQIPSSWNEGKTLRAAT
ncbi:MAG: LacI family DNA-binding transcriptional regulator [Kiritimatiellales bacterium]